MLLVRHAGGRLAVDRGEREIPPCDPNVELWIVPAAGHTGSYDRVPELYTQKVITFFERALDGSVAPRAS